MREIKFRAWDKEQECMVSWDYLMSVRYNERWFLDNRDEDYINCIFSDPDYTLMQYTGLKDKNGKEIYEGDIVKVPWNYGGDYKYEECGAFVVWVNEDCGFDLVTNSNKYRYVMQDWSWEDLEVIGNIYENKDLLEEK